MKKERMTATMKDRNLDTTAPDLSGAAVVVAGLGRSGLAAARFLAARGARVHASDVRPLSTLGEEAAAVAALGGSLETGGHVPERFAEADLVVVSPGVPLAAPALVAARNAGVPIWAEVELAGRFLHGPLIGVTGSNGKSTVVSLIAHLLGTAGRDAVGCGNLGTPLISLVEDDRESRWYVVELSSFQLEGIRALRPHIAVVTNLTPDHQDRYPSLAEYGEAKARIFRNQDGSDHAILNADDPLVATMGDRHGGPRRWLFAASGRSGAAAVLRDGRLLLADPGTVLLDAAELPIAGRHNVENALAASLAANLAGVDAGDLAAGLRSFRGLPHRMEVVGEAAGVVWYNDSKATNLGATRRVVESLDRPLVLILGGRDKGADFASLRELLRDRCRHVILMGEAREVIARALGDAVPLTQVDGLADAVPLAADYARAGDAVLLAPACASFDAYRNFEERGEHFRSLVRKLPGGGDG